MPSKEELFEKETEKIHRYLRTDVRFDEKLLKRPFIFEFTGTPSAGKSTTINELDKLLRRKGFRVNRPQEEAEAVRHIDRTEPLYNFRTAFGSLNRLIDCAKSHSYDVVLLDRCAFDAYCWMKYWREKNKLTPRREKIFQEAFLDQSWINFIDSAYFMVCDPEIAVQREHRISLSKELGQTTNPETIDLLVRRYRQAYNKLRRQHPQLKLFDTTRLNERTMVDEIAQQVFAIMEKKSTAMK